MFAILIITLFVEFKYMRPRRRKDIETVIERDEAYNILNTTIAISSSLKGMGKDTREADLVLIRAQLEFDRNDYAKVIGSSKAARNMMINAPDAFQAEPEPKKVVAPLEEEEIKPEEKTVHEVKKLPENYLESKFLINTTKEEMEKDQCKDGDTAEAERHLADAEECFASARYGEAVKNCMKARRSLSGKPAESSTTATSVADLSSLKGSGVQAPEPEVETRQDQDVSVTIPDVPACTKCGEPLLTDDDFCGKCGTKVVQDVICKKCGVKMNPDDAFCRKCGNPLD
jgi:hypothetical protein